MKANFNLTDLKTVKHQRCEKCFFNGIHNYSVCAMLPLVTCLRDSQIYIPTQEFFEIFNL